MKKMHCDCIMELYLQWFDFFLHSIPPTRPVLLIQDGHVSHMSVELIELARANNIHLSCLPSHTTHILQPLDVGVFKYEMLFINLAPVAQMIEHLPSNHKVSIAIKMLFSKIDNN